jgi:hypothetical protein
VTRSDPDEGGLDEAALARERSFWDLESRADPPETADVDHAPGCPRLRPDRDIVGNRADGALVTDLRCPRCHATVRYLGAVREDRWPDLAPRLMGSGPPTEPVPTARQRQSRRPLKTRAEIVAAEAAFDADPGPRRQPIWDRLGIGRSTYFDLRNRHGLPPRRPG